MLTKGSSSFHGELRGVRCSLKKVGFTAVYCEVLTVFRIKFLFFFKLSERNYYQEALVVVSWTNLDSEKRGLHGLLKKPCSKSYFSNKLSTELYNSKYTFRTFLCPTRLIVAFYRKEAPLCSISSIIAWKPPSRCSGNIYKHSSKDVSDYWCGSLVFCWVLITLWSSGIY